MSTCRCSHPADTHLHYRAGTDCGECGIERCGAYVPAGLTDDQALTYLALAPYALASEHIAEDPVTAPDPDPVAPEDPPADTAGEQDHSDPWAFAGDDADAPTDPDGGA